MRTKIASVVGGALAVLAVTASTAYAGHHQTHSTPTGSQTVTVAAPAQEGGPYKPTHRAADALAGQHIDCIGGGCITLFDTLFRSV